MNGSYKKRGNQKLTLFKILLLRYMAHENICTITVIEVGITNQKAMERDHFSVKELVEVVTLVLHISIQRKTHYLKHYL